VSWGSQLHRYQSFEEREAKVKIRLHKPKRGLWNVALLLFILGVVGAFVGIPILSQLAFYLILISAALLLLGTWVV
jgi:fatty acid desaturase